jgi:hypothetical protein
MYYTAFQRMMSDDKDYESLQWIRPTKTERAQDSKGSISRLGLILGISFGLLLLIAIVVAGVVRVYIVKKPKTQTGESVDALEMHPERE